MASEQMTLDAATAGEMTSEVTRQGYALRCVDIE
jgi:hypothetical protein